VAVRVAGAGKDWAGSSFCNASRKRFRGRFRRRSGLRLWLGFRLGQRSRAASGFRGWFRRSGLRLWLGLRRGHRPRPGFRRLRPWPGRRPRRRLRVRPLRHCWPLLSRDRRRLHRFGARRFRQCRLRLARIVGHFARVHRVSAGVICCHPGIVPGLLPATRAAAASGQVACTGQVSGSVRDDSVGVGGAVLVTDLRGRPAGGRGLDTSWRTFLRA
jgi:hypothetical protein